MNNGKAIVLVSGGLDSAVTLAIAIREDNYKPENIHALSFYYGQRHAVELRSAQKITEHMRVGSHNILEIPVLGTFGGSALTDARVPLRDAITEGDSYPVNDIPTSYVPGRNMIFLSLAAAYAETLDAEAIYYGANALDYSGYTDCRPAFVYAFNQMLKTALKRTAADNKRLIVVAPIIGITKAKIIQKGIELGVPLSLTHSCYSPSEDGKPCGRCDSCVIREKGFKEAGIAV
jgi:7-cyano-7-deazaguanine synthase